MSDSEYETESESNIDTITKKLVSLHVGNPELINTDVLSSQVKKHLENFKSEYQYADTVRTEWLTYNRIFSGCAHRILCLLLCVDYEFANEIIDAQDSHNSSCSRNTITFPILTRMPTINQVEQYLSEFKRTWRK